ncbi:GNAT family N-acetyltransferase [Streptomyces sp. NPDC024089]|uniref:GNAT family N-acetyltransferase n=1 Tax=Streptomyces sp. NPDC024089 TaxID=3154328 RepID=UPI0033C45159
MERPKQIIECGDFALRRRRGQCDFDLAFTLVGESLDHLRPWMPWVAHHSEENTRDFLAESDAKWDSGDAYNFAITRNGGLIGMCSTYRGAEPEGWYMGDWLHPAVTGQGIRRRRAVRRVPLRLHL